MAVAALGLAYFSPATAQFSHFLPLPPSNSCFLSLTTKPFKSNLQIFFVQAQAQTQLNFQPETAQENVVEEDVEVSNTRLLVQNVPWTCAADDLRPLFENYGAVVDIELSMYNKTRNRGLAFVTMASNEEAVASLNNLESN